jgi:hypothetical protein
MTEDSHLPAWPAALPKCFREHRLPRREVLRPLENELWTAGNATVGDAECISPGRGKAGIVLAFWAERIRGLTVVPLSRSEKSAVAQSIQLPPFYLQQGCALTNGTALGRRQAPLFLRTLICGRHCQLSSKPAGRTGRNRRSSAADPIPDVRETPAQSRPDCGGQEMDCSDW